VYLLDNDKREDLARMHRMFSLVESGLAPISQAFRQYVTDRGSKIVDERVDQVKQASKSEALGDPSFIQTLLDLHDLFKGIVQEFFSQDSLFQKSLKEAFEVFINRDIGKYSFAALMSSFCDRILKKSGERLSDDMIEVLLTKMVELFSFLSDKDLFAEIYRNQLSKRLLYETSASEDAEKSMIAKLKMKCGAQFTSKLEGMITDLSLAADFQKDFREHCDQLSEGKSALGGIDFNVTVLTTGFWPSYQVQDANLCPEMQRPYKSSTTSTTVEHSIADCSGFIPWARPLLRPSSTIAGTTSLLIPTKPSSSCSSPRTRPTTSPSSRTPPAWTLRT